MAKKRVVRPARKNWKYFTLEPVLSYGFYIVDEDGERLMEDGWYVIVTSQLEAEEYLIEHDIRGNVR